MVKTIEKAREQGEREMYAEALEEISSQFGVGRLLGVPKLEFGSNINDVFRLETTEGKYMLRSPRREVDEKAAKKKALEYEVTDHLTSARFPYEVPNFLYANNEQRQVISGGRVWDMYKRIEGKHPKKGEMHQRLVEMVAKYHEAMEDFSKDSKPQTPRSYSESDWIPRNLQKMIDGEDLRLKAMIEENKDEFLEFYHSLLQNARPGKISVVAHSDLHLGNILARDGKISGILDFGNVKWATRAEDLIKLTSGEPFQNFLLAAQYRRHRDLSLEEQEEILPLKSFRTLSSIAWAQNLYGGEKLRRTMKKRIENMKRLKAFWDESQRRAA